MSSKMRDLIERHQADKEKPVVKLNKDRDLVPYAEAAGVSVRDLGQVQLLEGERQPGETVRAVLACNDFLRMGPSRSIGALARRYKDQIDAEGDSGAALASPSRVYYWSSKFNWVERAESYDAKHDVTKTEEALSALSTGLALPFKRVIQLKALADRLEREIFVEDNLWLEDVKQIGAGKSAEKVYLKRFNTNLVEQYRGVLDDLARETGGRIAKIEQETKNANAIMFVVRRDDGSEDTEQTIVDI